MALLFCILNAYVVSRIAKKRIGLNKNYFGYMLLSHIFISFFLYIYYIGYSKAAIGAAMTLTVNTLYFFILSAAVSGLLLLLLKLYKDDKHDERRLSYNLTQRDKMIFIISVFAALLTRLIGFYWGGGMTLCPDEGKMVNNPRDIMMANNTLMSDDVLYPAQISHKILSICFKLYKMVCDISNIEYSGVTCYYIGRVYTALLSAGIVICIFFIGNYLKKHAGTVACILAAVFSPFIQTAHTILGDVVTAFLGCLAILCAFRYLQSKHGYRWLFAMSFLAAASTLEKWNGMVACGLIAVVVIVKNCRERTICFAGIVKEGLYSIGSVVISFALIAPNLIGRLPEMIDSIFHFVDGYEGNNTFIDNFSEYMMEFFSHAGILCLPLLIVGICILWQEKRIELSALSIGLLSMIGMCMQNRAFIRWGYPFYLCFIILIGAGVVGIWESRYLHQHNYVRMIFAAALLLIGVNQFAATVLLDIIYINSQSDTRLVSEKWCLEQGIRVEDCIYDHYTCWSPGGVSRYRIEWDDLRIKNKIYKDADTMFINRLGKKYAFANLTKYPEDVEFTSGLTEIMRFETSCRLDGLAYDFYHTYSNKIYEPYSIYDSIRKSIDILSGKIYIGSDLYVYDISDIPVRETFDADDFDLEIGDGKMTYIEHIPSISDGIYSIHVSEPSFVKGTIVLEDEAGTVITEVLLEKGQAVLELTEHYYHLNLKVIVDEEDTFRAITIST